ncbi:MAG: sugar ABC transporter substrate-binding protein [Candidatus Binatia bacterium]|nr:sugar ABC transporter substrate-binding protein [Candidatus Binatia bacterium]
MLSTAAFAVLTGCQGTAESAPALKVWAMGKEAEYLFQTVDGQRVAGHRVEVQRIPWSAAHEKLLTAYVAGTLPDVIQLGSTWIPEFVAVGALACQNEAKAELVRDFFPGAIESSRSGGAWCATPWYVDTRVLFYRRDLLTRAGFADPPRTWEEWRQAMARIRELGPDHYGLLAPLDEWQLLVALAFQAGADLLREHDTRGNFRSAAFRRALSFYVSLFHDGFAPFQGPAQVANVYQDFAAGLFTFYVTGPWNLGEFRRRLPPGLQEHWATAVLPTPELGRPSVSVMGGASLAITKSCTKPEAAQQVIDFLLSTDEQVRLHRATGDLPARRSAWKLLGGNDAERLLAFRLQLEHARSTPPIPEWERIAGLLVRYTELVVRGHLTIDTALTQLDEETDRVLAKRRWLLQRSATAP